MSRDEALRAESVRLEQETGYDSIPSIERVYELTLRGAFCCPYPGCEFKRHDAEQMWRHVHYGPHGKPFAATGDGDMSGTDKRGGYTGGQSAADVRPPLKIPSAAMTAEADEEVPLSDRDALVWAMTGTTYMIGAEPYEFADRILAASWVSPAHFADLCAEVERLTEILRRVVMDYCEDIPACDSASTCDCSMAAARRHIADTAETP